MTLLEPVLFRGEHPVERLDWDGSADPRELIAAHAGHFAIHERNAAGEHLLARDLLGVHKLFFAVGPDGRLDAATYMVDLLRAGHAIDDVFSVPSGHYVRVHPGERRYSLVRWGNLAFGASANGSGPARTLDEYVARIRAALERTFRMLVPRVAGRPVYVTLSGGLDSTTIAALAREHFTNVHAVTFALRNATDGEQGSDLSFARRVAVDLGLPLIEVLVDPDGVLELLDDVLVYGQDWRDFNVHCGLANAAIGRAIGARHRLGPRPVVLTGDTMNELLADYAPVELDGKRYYELPQLERGRMRRFLVHGLDAGDREVGIFARFGLETVQPYALCAHEYAALPGELACEPGSKARLVRAVMNGGLPDYVYSRPKVRAQVAVGSVPGGTFALMIARGIDQQLLRERFARLLAIDPSSLNGLLRAGVYRFSALFPGRAA
jgi:asparagine synthetase B (glutamine-hydrolysing)